MKRVARLCLMTMMAFTIAGCGQNTAGQTAKPPPVHGHATKKVTFPDPASRACMTALKPMGVPMGTLYWPDSGVYGPIYRQVRLPSSFVGGPKAQRGRQSPLLTAYENLLSAAVGYPLAPYLGSTVREVDLAGGPDGMSGYVCLEDKRHVIGVWGEQADYTPQPGLLVTAKDQTFQSLAGTDFLSWLMKNGYYHPRAVADSSGFTAEQALENSFAVMNDPSLSTSQRTHLLATYYATSRLTPMPPPLVALVPLQISYQPPLPGPRIDLKTQQEFAVMLWPHWSIFPPPSDYMAGNGLQGMFYTMVRPTGTSMWKIGSEGTGG